MGLYINCAPIRNSRATRRAPADDYMLRAALVVTHFFWAKTDMSQTCLKRYSFFDVL